MKPHKIKRIAVIGGKGFIGSNIINTIDKEYTDSIVIDKKDFDLSHDNCIDSLQNTLTSNKINTVISLAAIKRQNGDTKEIFRNNNKITINICKAIQDLNCKVIYYSSCAVYGEKNEQIRLDERSPIQPTSHYGEHKAISENIYQKEIENNKLLIIRPPLIYSWLQKQGYQPGGFLADARESGQIYLWGDGGEKREFIHIQDAADITKLLIEKECHGKVIMASSKSYSYRSIAENISKITNCQINEKERTGIKVDHSYINKRLKEMIGNYNFRPPFVEE